MTENRKMVMGVFRNRLDAEKAFDFLHSRGYTESEIDVLMSDKTRSRYYPPDTEHHFGTSSAVGEGAAIGGAVGTAIGATLAAVAAIGTSLVIPGLGLVLAGPIAAAIAGAGAGAVTGGVVGGLVGLGISEPNAKAFEAALRDGGIVVGVSPHDDDEVSTVKKEFERLHGENVYVTSA